MRGCASASWEEGNGTSQRHHSATQRAAGFAFQVLQPEHKDPRPVGRGYESVIQRMRPGFHVVAARKSLCLPVKGPAPFGRQSLPADPAGPGTPDDLLRATSGAALARRRVLLHGRSGRSLREWGPPTPVSGRGEGNAGGCLEVM
jgi:hypothetical protein